MLDTNTCDRFIEDMRISGLKYTEFKMRITANNQWKKYDSIRAKILFSGGRSRFSKPGVTTEAHKYIMKHINHNINTNYKPIKVIKG